MAVVTNHTQPASFYTLVDPKPEQLGTSVEAFLSQLPGPTHIVIPGHDASRRRLLVSLIHGNEPSGLYAIYKFIQNGITPAVDLHCVLPSVIAAQAQPLLSHRMLPEHRDLNRCFRPPFTEQSESQLAQQIMSLLDAIDPEAVVDMHNTSGSGPDFAVTTFVHDRHNAVLSLFTQRSVLTEIRLGALMELSTVERPIVTVECGGSHDHESHAIAFHGLQNFAQTVDIFQNHAINLDIYQHPIRVELQPEATVGYDDEQLADVSLTLVKHIEEFNFGVVDNNTVLGFLPSANFACLRANTSQGLVDIRQYFTLDNGRLRPTRPLKLFMITTNSQIASSDCLFYFVTLGNP